MPPRLKLALIVAALAICGLVAAAVLAGPQRQRLHLVQGFAGAQAPPGALARDFALRDSAGAPVRLTAYRGHVVVLTFLYSTCRSTCPVIAQQIRGALDSLPGAVPALAVSVDPAGDTPLNARRFLVKQSVNGRIRFLLGSRAELAPIWSAYGIEPQTELKDSPSDHTAYVLLIGRDGRRRVGFPASELTPEALAHDIRRLQSE